MKKPPRWLHILGILAVGFVVGRYTATPEANGLPAERQIVSDNEPIVVEVVPMPVSQDQSTGDDGAASLDQIEESNVDSSTTMTSNDQEQSDSSAPVADDPAARFVGTWFANTSHGTRLTKLNADGTGNVHAKLDWIASLLYGGELHIDVTWVIDDDMMIHTVTSGTPKKNIDALVRDYGSVKEYRIDKFETDTMTLVDPTDGEVIIWHRRDHDAKLD